MRQSGRGQPGVGAFTLIELMVVVSVIALLATLVMPVLARAREMTRRALCGSNIRGLAQSNCFYAQSNNMFYVPAAVDVFTTVTGSDGAPANGIYGGFNRWHGVRVDASTPFDPAKGPLVPYIGSQGKLKECPVSESLASKDNAKNFEKGCGGYGYNENYIGGRYDKFSGSAAAEETARSVDVASPSATVMFTDAGIVQKAAGGTPIITEYSFCESPYAPNPAGPSTMMYTPSIHFRHLKTVSVAWVDTHVSYEKLTFTKSSYGVSSALVQGLDVGWFGQKCNDLFDLK